MSRDQNTTLPSPLVGTTLDADSIEHRLGFVQYVLEKAEPWYRAHLTKLYAHWRAWTQQFFDGTMVEPYLMLATPKTPNAWGDCGPVSGFGGKSQIRLRRSLLDGTHPAVFPGKASAAGRFVLVSDVLSHEMIHQYQQEVLHEPETSYHGHGPIFQAHANRIGALLGLSPVRTSKARGKEKALPSCSHWPHIVRPAHFYHGALRPPGETKPTSLTQVLRAFHALSPEEQHTFRERIAVPASKDTEGEEVSHE
jgi:hypothetical protein